MATLDLITTDDLIAINDKLEDLSKKNDHLQEILKEALESNSGKHKPFLVKTKEAMRLLSISYYTLKALKAQGRLTPVHIGEQKDGGYQWFRVDEIKKLAETGI